ncbi:YidH family protein [Salinifilum ghardaiensis]
MASEPDGERWPRRLYATGDDPDPRFSLANERTFLAWIRTALALMAAGVGVEALNVVPHSPASPLRTILAVLLVAGGVACAGGAFHRWFATERALRAGRTLPAPRLGPVLGYGLVAAGVLACVLMFLPGV